MVRRLLLLNGLAAVFAVSHHAVPWVLNGMFWWTDRYMETSSLPDYRQVGSVAYYLLRLIDQVVMVAVPAFLLGSGYFVATATGRQGRTVGWEMVFNRIKSLLPPYFIWSTVAILLSLVSGETFTAWRLIWIFVNGGAAAQFYYVPLLVKLYLVSPWMFALARDHWKALLLGTGIPKAILAVVRSREIADAALSGASGGWLGMFINSSLVAYTWWFALGLVIGVHLPAFKAALQRFRAALPLLLAAAHASAFVEWELLRRESGRPWTSGGVILSDDILCLVALMTYFAFDGFAPPFRQRLEQIGTMSFGIYLAHLPVVEVLARVVYHVAPALLAYAIPFQALLVIAGVGAPVLLMMLVRRSPFRQHYALLFG